VPEQPKTPANTSEPKNPLEEFDVVDPSTLEAPANPLPPAEGPPGESSSLPSEESSAPPRGPDGRFLPRDQAPEAPKPSPRFRRIAVDLGFSDEEIDGSTPEVLEAMVHERQRAILYRENRQPDSPVQTPPPVIDWGKDEDGKPMAEADIHPGVANAMKEMARQIADLRNLLHQSNQARVNETVDQQVERFFTEANDARYGKGPVSHTSQEYQRRMTIIQEAIRLAGPKADIKQRLAKLSEAKSNIESLWGTPAPTPPAPNTQTPEQKRWANAGLAMPTNRNVPAKQKSVALAKEMFAEGVKGLALAERNGTAPEGDETSELPE